MMLIMVTACGANTGGGGGGGGDSARGGLDVSNDLYIGVYAASALDYFYDHKIGLAKAGEDFGVQAEFLGPTDYDMSAVIATMDQSIGRNPDGIMIIGWEESIIPSIDKAVDAGIPVVTIDADLEDSKRIAFVGTGNFAAGQMNAQALVDMLGGQGKVAVVGSVVLSNIQARAAGCMDIFDKYPGIEVVERVAAEADDTTTAANTAALLQKYPDLDGIATLDGTSGGVATAVREAGKAGEIAVIAFDRGDNILDAIEQGWISGTVVQQTALMPYYALTILFNLKHFPVDITSDNAAAGISGVPSDIDTGVVLVTKENLKYFQR